MSLALVNDIRRLEGVIEDITEQMISMRGLVAGMQSRLEELESHKPVVIPAVRSTPKPYMGTDTNQSRSTKAAIARKREQKNATS